MPRRTERGLEDLRRRIVRRDLTGEDGEDEKGEEDDGAGERLPVARDRAPDVAGAPVPDLGDGRRRAARGRRELVGRPEGGGAHRTSRVRGSRSAVAASAARIAVRTATTIIMKSPCIRA